MFLYLLFAHLVADFILQPSTLIKWKFESWKGVAVHAGIHFLVSFVIFLPFLFELRVVLGLLGIAISHFCIDTLKVKQELKNHHYVRSFVTDQLLHFFFLAVATWFIGQPAWHLALPFLQNFYASKLLWIGLSSALIASFVVEVFLYQFAREKNNPVFKPHYLALLLRGVVVAVACIGWVILGFRI